MEKCFSFLTMAAMLSLATSETCGYVRRPLAAMKDTVVIHIDCKQFHPPSLPFGHNVTRVAVQLRNCHTVPSGLFSRVADKLTSVSVASKDTVQLPEGTFDGRGSIQELRILGFGKVLNVSRSLFVPLLSIETLILDRFCRSHIALSYLGSMIQKLSNTPLKRIVLNDIRDIAATSFEERRTFRSDDFTIRNASVKELVISDTSVTYEGSIRKAFPHLDCFHSSIGNVRAEKTYPATWDLVMLSNTLKEIVLCRSKDVPFSNLLNVTLTQYFPLHVEILEHYPELNLKSYFLDRPTTKICAANLKFKAGANISRITLNRVGFLVERMDKPLCVEESNKIEYLDFAGSPMPTYFAGFRGLLKIKYLNLENTHINSLANDFLHYLPSLEVLKLGTLDIRNFITSTDSNFFAFSNALKEVYLDSCQLMNIPVDLFSRLSTLEQLDLSRNSLQDVVLDLRNCTELKTLNISNNNISSIAEANLIQLNELALKKPAGNSLVIDFTNNRLHCLCNSTHFVDWLLRSPNRSNIKFVDFSSYSCLHPNGSVLPVSATSAREIDQQCAVLDTLKNNSHCPCEEEQRERLSHVRMSLDGFFCTNDLGHLVPMSNQPFLPCFKTPTLNDPNPYIRASFIAPVTLVALLGITMIVLIVLLYRNRHSRRVKQVRECLEMNPARFLRVALQYVMLQNHHAEQDDEFRYDLMIFAQDDDRGRVHHRFIEALTPRNRTLITRDDFRPGAPAVDAMAECIRVCRSIVVVLTSNFTLDPVCMDFLSKVRFSRPHALLPIIWEQPLVAIDLAMDDLLRTGDPLYWPGDQAALEDKRTFWESVLERTQNNVTHTRDHGVEQMTGT